MKVLKKLLLINWHYFSFQEMNFDQINFLTGKNASGKTTIIDALQLLILGDTAGRYFNKSATDKSNRSLKGYLRCEFGDNDDGTTLYLRNGKFTSYIVSEFYDDVEQKPFTLGVVIDSFSDESYEYKFFFYKDKILNNSFVVNNVPMNQKDLRVTLTGNYRDVHFFETNASYREFCKTLFGNLNNSFFTLFKKAIPFSPIANIEQFITDYVCDVKETIDITSMQENIRDYKRLEIEATEIAKRLEKLATLNEKYNGWKSDFDQVSLQKYLVNRGELYLANKFLDKLDDNIKDIKNEIEDKNRILKNCDAQIQKLKEERDSLVQEKFGSDVYKQKAVYEQKLNDVEGQIAKLEAQVSTLQDSLANYIYIWNNAARNLLNNSRELTPALVNATKSLINELAEIQKEKSISLKILQRFQNATISYLTTLSSEGFTIRNNTFQLNQQRSVLEQEITALKSGHKAYNAPLMKFKEVIEEDLKKQYNKDIKVDFLADLMDIKDDSWRMAIETYLYSQRFYLIVEPEYVDAAIASYERNKKQYHFSSFGILDTEKIASSSFEIQQNSIVNEISSKNEIVMKYVASLMGSLIKCERIENLRKHNRSLTKTGMLYQGYVARQLNLDNTIPFIGSGSTQDQLDFKQEQLQNLNSSLLSSNNITKLLDSFQHLEAFNTNEIKSAEISLNEASVLPSLQSKKQEYVDLMKSFSDNYLENVEKNIARCDTDIIDLETERNGLYSDIGQSNKELKIINDEKVPEANEAVERCKNVIKTQYERNWIIETGEPAFMEASLANKNLVVYLQNVRQSISSINSRINSRWNSLVELRMKYNAEYNLNNDTSSLENDYYVHQYDDFNNTKLVEYKEKISAAKENAMKQFKNDFLSKLKSNFDTVITQIDNLNDALESSTFGEDSYHFTVSPRSEYRNYYDMINDPMLLTGQDINSTLFQQKYGEVIEDLFHQITFVDDTLGNDLRSEIEKNIVKFTDYRSYLKFDLIVTNKYGNKLSLSRNLLKKSGGETQTPFYISVLASFAQAYRVKLANNKFNSIRLIIFDEAFSKMDSERIGESVKLLRQFGLQAIISAPPEKMADISGLVDKTLCVIRNNTVSVISEFKDLHKGASK